MAKVQISKILIRSGLSNELPGAPTSLSPLTFPKGLDKAEFGFATDTNRLYIGANPTTGQSQFNRTVFPYRNIEVLTENSTDTVEEMIGNMLREGSNRTYHSASLLTHTTDWGNVIVPRTGDANYVYRIPYADSVTAQIEYSVFGSDNKTLKSGTISLQYFDGEAEPHMVDEYTATRRLDLTEPDASNPEKMYNYASFRFVVDGPLGARYLSFQYNNNTDSMLYLRFKVITMRV